MEFLSTAGSLAARLGLWIVAFTAPANLAMAAIFALIVADYIVGIWAARKRGEKITSWGLRRTVTTKILPYYCALICGHLVHEKFLVGTVFEVVQLMKSTAGFIAVAELKSIFENLGQITGLDFWEYFRERLQPLKKVPSKDVQE